MDEYFDAKSSSEDQLLASSKRENESDSDTSNSSSQNEDSLTSVTEDEYPNDNLPNMNSPPKLKPFKFKKSAKISATEVAKTFVDVCHLADTGKYHFTTKNPNFFLQFKVSHVRQEKLKADKFIERTSPINLSSTDMNMICQITSPRQAGTGKSNTKWDDVKRLIENVLGGYVDPRQGSIHSAYVPTIKSKVRTSSLHKPHPGNTLTYFGLAMLKNSFKVWGIAPEKFVPLPNKS